MNTPAHAIINLLVLSRKPDWRADGTDTFSPGKIVRIRRVGGFITNTLEWRRNFELDELIEGTILIFATATI